MGERMVLKFQGEELVISKNQIQTILDCALQSEAKIKDLEAKLSIAVEALELIDEDYANGVAIYAGEALEKIRGNNETT